MINTFFGQARNDIARHYQILFAEIDRSTLRIADVNNDYSTLYRGSDIDIYDACERAFNG